MNESQTLPASIAIDPCWKRTGVAGNRQCPELPNAGHCRNCDRYAAATIELLDREPPADYLDQWTARLAREDRAETGATIAVIVFRLATEWLALPAELFEDVTAIRPIRPIPNRSNEILQGLVNVRGTIHLCVSLAKLLGIEPRLAGAGEPCGAGGRLLVISREGQRWAFAVEEVHGIHRFEVGELVQPPSTAAHAGADQCRGIFRWREGHVGFLDARRLFETLERSLG